MLYYLRNGDYDDDDDDDDDEEEEEEEEEEEDSDDDDNSTAIRWVNTSKLWILGEKRENWHKGSFLHAY